MNFLNLRYFTAVAEALNFTSAAAALGISQQALSGHIAKLEEYFGQRLFDRTPPVRLTEAGERLYGNARRMLELKKSTECELQEIKDFRGGELTVGVTSARAAFVLPTLLSEFHRQFPQVRLHLLEGNSPDIMEALYKGKVDLTIGFEMDDPQNVQTYFLQDEYSVIAVPENILEEYFPKDAKMSGRKRLKLSTFAHCPFVTIKPTTWAGSIFENCCREEGFTPNVVIETGHIMSMISLCSAGLGVIVCPRIFLRGPESVLSRGRRKKVRIFQLDYEPAHRQISVNCLRNWRPPRIMRHFIAMAKEIYKE